MCGRLFAVFHRGAAAATVKAELGAVVESQYRFITKLFFEFAVSIFTVEKRVVNLRARAAQQQQVGQQHARLQRWPENTTSPGEFEEKRQVQKKNHQPVCCLQVVSGPRR